MSISLSNAFVTLFDAEVKQAYQGKAMLVPAVRQRRGVEGSTVKFPKVGKGVATPRVGQTDVTPLNVGFSSVTLTLSDFNAAEYSDIFSQAKVNFDERQELVQVVASAMGRRQDQMILDALAASSTALTVANSIGGANTNLNVAKLRAAKRLLDKNNVPADGRHIIIHAWVTAAKVACPSTVLWIVLATPSTLQPLATVKASACAQRSTTSPRRPAGWLTKCLALAPSPSTLKASFNSLAANLDLKRSMNHGLFFYRLQRHRRPV